MSTSSAPRGAGLFEITRGAGEQVVTNIRRLAGTESAPGRGLISTAAVLLGLLDAGLFAVSLAAQYQYILHAKHQHWPAIIEAVALDAGMVIFSLLALGLARSGQSARIERALILACSCGSAGMNYAAADVTSPRSVLAYTMPPVFLAVVTDRVIAVLRRHVLGMDAERSAWTAAGRAALALAGGLARAGLYTLRLVLAPKSTGSGLRRCVLLATPLPGSDTRPALAAIEAPADGDGENAAAVTADMLAAEMASVRETLRTEISSVHETLRTEISSVQALISDDGTAEPPPPDRDTLIAELADEIRDAISSGTQWTPDYAALHQRTGRSRSWHEKAVREARTQAFTTPYELRTDDPHAGAVFVSWLSPDDETNNAPQPAVTAGGTR